MKIESKLAKKIESGDFIVTAEYMPVAGTNSGIVEAAAGALGNGVLAVNVADNHCGVAMSSLAASVSLNKASIEPVFQIVTRDRNRIALQSDLLGAACLGIKNVLCQSGYHQTLSGCPESANVYDIDSIQLIAAKKNICEKGELIDGTKIEGEFSMLIGAAANPDLRPLELNIIRLGKKIEAGASFIQTQAVFEVEAFDQWLQEVNSSGLSEKAAIIAGVMPLDSAAEAEKLCDTYTDFRIPDKVIERLKAAGDEQAQKKEGLAVCAEIIKSIKDKKGLRGIHILSGGKEAAVPELCAAAGL